MPERGAGISVEPGLSPGRMRLLVAAAGLFTAAALFAALLFTAAALFAFLFVALLLVVFLLTNHFAATGLLTAAALFSVLLLVILLLLVVLLFLSHRVARGSNGANGRERKTTNQRSNKLLVHSTSPDVR